MIGGTSLFGGRGEVQERAARLARDRDDRERPEHRGLQHGTIYVVTGIILLLAVTLDTIARRLQVKSGR